MTDSLREFETSSVVSLPYAKPGQQAVSQTFPLLNGRNVRNKFWINGLQCLLDCSLSFTERLALKIRKATFASKSALHGSSSSVLTLLQNKLACSFREVEDSKSYDKAEKWSLCSFLRSVFYSLKP